MASIKYCDKYMIKSWIQMYFGINFYYTLCVYQQVLKLIVPMGIYESLCGERYPDTSFKNFKLNKEEFLQALSYYNQELDPVTQSVVQIYSFNKIFVQKRTYFYPIKEQIIKKSSFLIECARVPTGVQNILHIASQKDIKCTSNYSVTIYAEHLNFNIKQHLDCLRFKGASLNDKEIFYILRELVLASTYLSKKRMKVISFDPSDLYLSPIYEIKIPYENIVLDHSFNNPTFHNSFIQINRNKQILYLSPEQLNIHRSGHQITQFLTRCPSISRVFSLGILIIQCATMLDSAVTYYNYNQRTIDLPKLNKDIKLLKNHTLAAILSRMLQLDPRKRIKFKELQNIISQLEESIFEQYIQIQ